MRTRNVYIDRPPPADRRHEFVELTAADHGPRMFAIELRNRGRTQSGTATLWGWSMILRAIRRRYPVACISPKGREPIVVRSRRA
jgi:hypothetical protein